MIFNASLHIRAHILYLPAVDSRRMDTHFEANEQLRNDIAHVLLARPEGKRMISERC